MPWRHMSISQHPTLGYGRPFGSEGGAFTGIVHFCGLFPEEFRRNCERPRCVDWAFLSTVGAVCNLQTNQLCLTLIDPNSHYDPIPVKKRQTIPRRINDAGIIAACHCGAEYESDYSESIDTHPVQSINTSHRKSTDADTEKSVDTYPDEWENDYYNPTIAAYTTSFPSIDTQPQQQCRKRASTDTAYYKSIDTEFNHVRDGDYSIGSWADEHHQESFVVEIATHTPGADEVFTDEELLNMQKHEFGIFRDPNGFAKAIDGCTLHVSREDIADILQTTIGADNMFMHQRSKHKTTKEFNDTAGGIDNSFNQQSRHTTHPSINTDAPTIARQPEFSRRAYDLYDGRTIPVHTKDIKRLLERASRDKPAYICLPEHASSFTQTKLVLEIYTKDEINEMF
ncbi:hypothetical protein DY000_02015949 [Brassica cretica]|uniref:Uncharacterized protein n=1 Tax=Brassica cretica TaxID=69181 RepID=A0ABQ7D231_BRACR|nr:hypothetical protein DY000_02015949 [Brassica cretica]